MMLVTIDSGHEQPLYVQIRDQLRERIASGALKVGDRLEPSRDLAEQLGVHRTTVNTAYAELEAEGLIQGVVGRGTFVAPYAEELRRTNLLSRRSAGSAAQNAFWNRYLAPSPQNDSLGRLMERAQDASVISFAAAHSPENFAPVELVRRAARIVLRREGAKLLEYGASDGYLPLREALQARLSRDGLAARTDEILITSGCQQGIDLVARALVEPGDTVAMENPTYTGLWNVFEASGARLIGVPLCGQGLDLDYLAAVLEQNKVKLIFTLPNFQNPTGVTLPLAARRRLLELAVKHQTPVVEDDVYGGLRYRGRPIAPLRSLDPAAPVIYLNSFSKMGFPGLRVGWIAASKPVIQRLRAAKARADLHTNLLGQAILAEFLSNRWLDKWMRQLRQAYARRLEIMQAAARRCFPPEVLVGEPEGGMCVWVELPPELDAEDILVKSRERGVVFAPARYFYFQNARHNALRLSFTAVEEKRIAPGIKILGEVLKAEVTRARKSLKIPREAAVPMV